MTNYTYSKISAANFNTSPATVARSATGSVYAVGDTTYTTPLNMTLVVGGSVVTSISSDSNGYFPDFTLLDRTSCVWKQNSVAFATVLTTTDPVPGPPGASGGTGATGAQGVPGDVSTWKPTTFYPLNTPVTNPSGDLVKVTTAHTSTSTYDATKFAPTGADATKLTGVVPDTNLRADLTVAALSATYIPRWKPTTAYLAGDKVLSPGGDVVSAIANFTSGASYNAANWNLSPTYVPTAAKGAASGVGTLDSAAKPVEERVYAATQSRPRKPLVTSLITQFATGHGWTNYSSSAASFTDDTTDYALGVQSVKSVTFTDNTPAQVQGGGYTVNATGKMVVIWLKVEGVANLTELNLYAGDASLANSYNWTIGDAGGVAQQVWREGEWMPVTLGFADAIPSGSPNRSSLNLFRLRSRATTGNAVTVHIGGLGLVDEPNAFPNGVISITCDDSYASQYVELRKSLDKYGWGATAYTIVDRLGLSGFMTLAQLQELEQNHNWEVAGHSYTMANHAIGYGNMTDADCEADVRNLKKWLVDNGFRGADQLAYPLGSYTVSTQAVMAKYFATARTVTNRLSETIRPSDRMRLRSLSVTNTIPLATAKALVDKTVANKGWGILTFHELVTTPTLGTHWAIADMIALIDYIATKGIPVMPVGEVSARMQNPDAVSSTASVLATATANIGAIVHAAMGNAPGKLNALKRQDAAAGIATTAGKVDIITFSPTLDMTITKLTAMTSGTAWTGHTLARMGLYTVDSAGAATLVAQTASDTALFIAAQTAYQKSLDTAGGYPASYTLVAGQRYAVGVLGVGQTAGQLRGGTSSSVLAQRTPVMGGTLGTGLTDLPTSGTITATGNYPWAELAA